MFAPNVVGTANATVRGVCGVIGTGGNIGGVAAGLLLRATGKPQRCFLALGICACGAVLIRFSIKHKQEEQALYDAAIAQRMSTSNMPLTA